jgi:acetyl-CoA synthetase
MKMAITGFKVAWTVDIINIDVINVAGHRMSTAEIESALVLHALCAEAAVVGIPDDITGYY